MAPGPNVMPFAANFRRYPYELAALLRRIDVAVAQIDTATILPAAADQLRISAKVGTVHFSNLLEGNELPLIEAERAASRELDPTSEAKLELVNYVEALDFLDQCEAAGTLDLTSDLILGLHRVLTQGLGREEARFKPRHEGAWRDGTARGVDRLTGTVFHTGPPPQEVPARMDGLCEWVTEREARLDEFPPPVLAGVVHFGITDIHPFADGNGRMARLLAVAVLMKHGYLPKHLFSFEAYYAGDRDAYYGALRSVRRETLNMESWLRYFLRGLAQEYERVAAKVVELGRLGMVESAAIQLTATQEKALAQLALENRREFSRRDYEELAGVNRGRAIRELGSLVTSGLIEARGRGPSSRYLLGRRPSSPWKDGRGRKPTWTEEKIERSLREFVGTRADWPTSKEFATAGQRALYEAVRRNGGAAAWARRIGVNHPRARARVSRQFK